MEKPSIIIPFEKGIEKQAARVETDITRLRQLIVRLEETRHMVVGWIDAARAQGDLKSVGEYEKDLGRVDRGLEGTRLLIEKGQTIIEERQLQQFQHEMNVFKEEMRLDILKDIGEELVMVEGLIARLEATETLSEVQKKELQELQHRKEMLELEKSKYEQSI